MTAMAAPSEPAAAPRLPAGGLGPPEAAPVPTARPRVRLPGRRSGGGRFRPYDEPIVPDPIASRLEELLAAVDGLLAAADGGIAPAVLAGALRTLAGDLRQELGAEALALRLEGLATSLTLRHWKEATAEVEVIRQLLKDRPSRRGWWR
jgi:hypothetical protein